MSLKLQQRDAPELAWPEVTLWPEAKPWPEAEALVPCPNACRAAGLGRNTYERLR